jgi:hypothetical protein
MTRGSLLATILLLPGLAVAGSLQVGGIEHFALPEAEVLRNDEPVLPENLPWLKGGRVYMELQQFGALAPPEALRLVFDDAVIGPVTSIAPLRVLGQGLSTRPDTLVLDLVRLDALTAGEVLAVSGHADSNGSVHAGRIARLVDGAPGWRLVGYVAQLDQPNARVRLGEQWVHYGLVNTEGCLPLPVVGQYVEIRAQPDPTFVPGQVLTGLQSFRCLPPVPLRNFGEPYTLATLVTTVPAADRFRIDRIDVLHNAQTFFAFGNADDLAPGVLVEIEGSFGQVTELEARSVRFREPMVRLLGTVAPAGVLPGGRLQLLGNEILAGAQTRDPQGVYGGLSASRQVEVRGYRDRRNRLHALHVADLGAPTSSVRLRGPVSGVAQPNVIVLGQAIDTSAATLRGVQNQILTSVQFFQQVSAGAIVDCSGCSYDAGLQRLSGGTVRLVARNELPPEGPLPLFRLDLMQEAWFGNEISRYGFEQGAP